MPTVLKSGSLNLLELSGPVQGSNGIALPLLNLMSTLTRSCHSAGYTSAGNDVSLDIGTFNGKSVLFNDLLK